MTIRARFTGQKDAEGNPLEHHNGIPARNLTQEDWDALDSEQRDLVRSSPIYTYIPQERSSTERASAQSSTSSAASSAASSAESAAPASSDARKEG